MCHNFQLYLCVCIHLYACMYDILWRMYGSQKTVCRSLGLMDSGIKHMNLLAYLM